MNYLEVSKLPPHLQEEIKYLLLYTHEDESKEIYYEDKKFQQEKEK